MSLSAQDVLSKQIALPSPAIAIAVEADPPRYFVATGPEILVLDSELQTLHKIETQMEFVHDLQWSAGKLIAAGGDPSEEGRVEVYATTDFALLAQQPMHSDVVQAIVATPEIIVTASADHQCRVVQAESLQQKILFQEHSGRVTSIARIPATEQVVSAGMDDVLRVWNCHDGALVRELVAHQSDVWCVDIWAPSDGLPMLVSVSADKTIRFWQPTIGRMVRFKKIEDEPVVCCWNDDQGTVFVGTRQGRILEVNANDLSTREIASLDAPVYALKQVALGRIAVGTSRSFAILDLRLR